ncbi:MAG: universal stress protein [Treponema sp.]|nr:universal stress protein [Treponema sp.]
MARDFFKKIIVAVNGSESSIHAAMYGIMMAKSYNLKIKAIFVVDTATIKLLSLNKFLIDEEKYSYEERLSSDGENYLKYVERLAQSKGVKIETELLKGGVYSEIVREAENYEADLLLLGGNRGQNRKIYRTSASDNEKNILLSSSVPVLFVNKPEIDRLFKNL